MDFGKIDFVSVSWRPGEGWRKEKEGSSRCRGYVERERFCA
jgi:hypothetical protein